MESISASSEAKLIKLFSLVYSPLARIARIAGDGEIEVYRRPDGTVRNVYRLKGQPMLLQAAQDRARQSDSECGHCGEAGAKYLLTYRFTIIPSAPSTVTAGEDCSEDKEQPPPAPGIDESQHLVTVFARPLMTCDPGVHIVRHRSPKCLYLWRCGPSHYH